MLTKDAPVDILRLIRVSHYTKNVLIFAPLFFAGRIVDIQLLLMAAIAFVAFCLAASSMYILNDWRDRESDRADPRKSHRPLAQERVPLPQASAIAASAGAGALVIAATVSINLAAIILVYLCLTSAYSFGLKQIALIDVVVIAVGFVVRLFAGSVATGVSLSVWIVIMTFLLALFIALAKRRDDVLVFEQTGNKPRRTVDGYNLRFLDSVIAIMASVIIVSYIAYTTSDDIVKRFDAIYLYLTVLFVILGLMRYLQLTLVMEQSSSPVHIALHDRFIQLVIVAWVLCFAVAIY